MERVMMKEILASYTPEKRASTSLWAKLFSRPLSFPVTYLFIFLGFSANAVSILSIFVSLAACLLLMLGPPFFWAGIGLFLFWDVLDCTDGNIARVKKSASAAGEYLDAVSGYTAPAFIYLAVGVAAYYTTGLLHSHEFVFILLGAAASVCDLLSRLIYQKYAVTEYKLGIAARGEKTIEEKRKQGVYRIADVVMRNLTYSCLFIPLLVIANVIRHFDILIAFYALYSAAILTGTYITFIRRALLLEKSKEELP